MERITEMRLLAPAVQGGKYRDVFLKKVTSDETVKGTRALKPHVLGSNS